MQTFKPIDIREMSTVEEKQPAAKLNTEITSVEQMRSDDDAFDDMKWWTTTDRKVRSKS